jgi:hypothetical protein
LPQNLCVGSQLGGVLILVGYLTWPNQPARGLEPVIARIQSTRIADRGLRDPGRRIPRSRATDPAIQGDGPRGPGRRIPRSRQGDGPRDPGLRIRVVVARSRLSGPPLGVPGPNPLGPAPQRALGWIPIVPLAHFATLTKGGTAPCQKPSYVGHAQEGVSTVCSAACIKDGREGDECEERGWTVVRIHKPPRIIIG